MCGIYFSIHAGTGPPSEPLSSHKALLNARGPDSQRSQTVTIPCTDDDDHHFTLFFYSTVLSLRGSVTVPQPVVDEETGCVLCWNGEAWKFRNDVVTENDTRCVFSLLMDAVQSSQQHKTLGNAEGTSLREHAVTEALQTVTGPYAFVFYDAVNRKVYHGRDKLGRRSLLVKHEPAEAGQESMVMCSVGDGSPGWSEVDADGVYVLELDGKYPLEPHRQAWSLEVDVPRVNRDYPPDDGNSPLLAGQSSAAVSMLEDLLRDSMALRVLSIPGLNEYLHNHHSPANANGAADASQVCHTKMPSPQPNYTTSAAPPLAILFSGGLDCTVLARLAHDLLPADLPIDLLNVAFENPRLQQAPRPLGVSQYDLCPDRITARSSLAELRSTCAARHWRLVEIDIPYSEVQQYRSTVVQLMSPHETEMDLSIALALYFAARGIGSVVSPTDIREAYTTPTRILFSGLGADELFGGYVRHATAFRHRGYSGLLEELQLDYSRLGKRNLGRDDRVISHWGKEARYPYLDEALVAWAVQARVDEKCGFGMPETKTADEPQLEPGKLVLRLLAQKLGLRNVSREKKRAIQFGARTAKMEGKTTGTATIKNVVLG